MEVRGIVATGDWGLTFELTQVRRLAKPAVALRLERKVWPHRWSHGFVWTRRALTRVDRGTTLRVLTPGCTLGIASSATDDGSPDKRRGSRRYSKQRHMRERSASGPVDQDATRSEDSRSLLVPSYRVYWRCVTSLLRRAALAARPLGAQR